MNIVSDRAHFVEQVVDVTKSALEKSEVKYEVNGEQICLANVLDNFTVPNFTDGIVSLSDDHQEGNAIPIVAIRESEAISFGKGFDGQSPIEHAKSIEAIIKWGLEERGAKDLVDRLSKGFDQTERISGVSFRSHAQAGTIAPSIIFNFEKVKSAFNLSKAPSAQIGRIAGRNLILLRMEPETLDSPQVVSHEIAHYVDRVNNPIKIMSSQRSLDMRALREELKAYQIGARVYMSHRDIQSVAPGDINDSQLLVEYIRASINRNDTDPYRPTPQIVTALESVGMGLDHILHGRINFDQILSSLHGEIE
jgi:hypothetical protein